METKLFNGEYFYQKQSETLHQKLSLKAENEQCVSSE